ncbi:UNVERIFIED_CONTAM: hypothetical protein PYX00_009542 [Menopon gallinae]|uniref:tRNA(Phe) (4-demethylwyosine(37)-C(7)) aminocarboxypropyltransferase n=1 Tax=Menopon gallinae TaxID=328185 RepID=A0AAW2HBK5_9NEOP
MASSDNDSINKNTFKDVFKFYKRKSAKLDLSNVYDFDQYGNSGDPCHFQDKVKKIQISNSVGIDWESSYGMKDPKEWGVFTFTLKPGLIYIKNPFKASGQRYWIARCLKDFTKKPNILNIDTLNILEKGIDWWDFCEREHNTKEGKLVLEKLRWATLGYHHNWDSKEYSEELKNDFPDDLKVFCKDLGNVLGFPEFNAEAAIINTYHKDSSLNGHTDHSEINLDAPLFSLSFGQSAIFLIGGKSLDEEPVPILLQSGDVIIMSKEARLCYHGVPRIVDSRRKTWSIELNEKQRTINNLLLDNETLKRINDDIFWKFFELTHFKVNMSKSPGELLKCYVHSYVDNYNLHEELKEEVPQKWEKYGDFVLFDGRSFRSDVWTAQGMEFWGKICEIMKCKRLALKSRIQKDGHRTPNVKMIVGDDPWILHVDNSIRYTWHVGRNMFCAGNAPERHRIAKLDCSGEVVVDLFAGIGYFVLPFLVHAKAEVVHACEWNPDAVAALRRNLKLNNVEDRCCVYEGDNREVCPKGVADRVNLGLIPSSEISWRTACEALKPTGGTLHVHGNVETRKESIACGECTELSATSPGRISLRTGDILRRDGDFQWKRQQWLTWAVHVLHSLISILRDLDSTKEWVASVENVHFVKSYAPHVDHLVLDVKLSLP